MLLSHRPDTTTFHKVGPAQEQPVILRPAPKVETIQNPHIAIDRGRRCDVAHCVYGARRDFRDHWQARRCPWRRRRRESLSRPIGRHLPADGPAACIVQGLRRCDVARCVHGALRVVRDQWTRLVSLGLCHDVRHVSHQCTLTSRLTSASVFRCPLGTRQIWPSLHQIHTLDGREHWFLSA